MKKNFTKLALIGLAVATVLAFGACSKYKGFKKTKSGIYYKFYGDIHDTAISPRTGDLVGVLLTLRAGDSTLFGPLPNEMLMDSLYEGDMFEALRMMHVEDTATFIFDGPKFFETMMEQEYPFGEDPLYLEVLLYGVMPKAEFEKMKAEYDAKLEVSRDEEKGKIDEYLEENPGLKLQPTGVYVKTVKNPIRQVKRQIYILARYLEYYGSRVWVHGYAILLHGNSPVRSEYVLTSKADIDHVIHTVDRRMLDTKTVDRIVELLS